VPDSFFVYFIRHHVYHPGMNTGKTDSPLQVISFKSPAEFRRWMAKHHAKSDGIWLRIFKKGSSELSITYAQALDQALCYGWIDGQKQKYDEDSWLQWFTVRRPKSGWSKINTQHAERLLKSGDVAPAGLKAIEAAQLDGRWQAAYDSPGNAMAPDDFLEALKKNKKAQAFFKTLNKANTYAIVYRLQTVKKAETRAKRIEQFVAMLARNKKLHP
jgi:uncharacterized protein YdeI (YjbR/CyaY-like superfamily)